MYRAAKQDGERGHCLLSTVNQAATGLFQSLRREGGNIKVSEGSQCPEVGERKVGML